MRKMNQVLVKISVENHKKLKVFCAMNETTVTAVVAQAVDEYLTANGIDKIELVKAS